MAAKKMKISLLLLGRGVAGSVRSSMRVGNELLARGHDVRIFYRDDLSGLWNRVRKIWLKLRYGFNNDWLLMFNGRSFCYRKLNATDFSSDELIISMCARTTFDMWNLPEEVGIKVLYCRGAEIQNRKQLMEALELPIYKIAISSRLAEMIARETNQPVVGNVGNGVDTKEYFSSILDSEREGIGSTFGWSKAKDPDSIIDIMQMLGRRLPGVSRHLFSSGKKPKGVKGVHFKRLPTIEEARRIYSGRKVWFLASISEGCPNPLLEAMACGCAVVSTDCGSPSDIIKDGVNGFLVEVGNTKAMVDKIVLLYNNEQLRNQICANATKTIESYSWPKAVDKLEGYLISIYDDEHH